VPFRGCLLAAPQVVIPSNDVLYLQTFVQARLKSYVQEGKGLIVVGPDVMPSFYYDPTARSQPVPSPSPPPALTPAPSASPPPPKRRGRSAQAVAAALRAADADGALPGNADSGLLAREAAPPAQSREAEAAVQLAKRRALAAGTGGPTASLNSSSVLVNVITAPTGIVFSGFVTDPVGLGVDVAPGAPRRAASAPAGEWARGAPSRPEPTCLTAPGSPGIPTGGCSRRPCKQLGVGATRWAATCNNPFPNHAG
jgi:hypothetical protein